MTLEERLCLARAGYSAQDIAQFEQSANFAKQEPKKEPEKAAEPAEPKQEPEKAAESKQEPEKAAESKQEPEKAPAWAVALEQSIKALTMAQQKANVKFDDMGEPVSVDQAALDALDKVYNGGKNK